MGGHDILIILWAQESAALKRMVLHIYTHGPAYLQNERVFF